MSEQKDADLTGERCLIRIGMGTVELHEVYVVEVSPSGSAVKIQFLNDEVLWLHADQFRLEEILPDPPNTFDTSGPVSTSEYSLTEGEQKEIRLYIEDMLAGRKATVDKLPEWLASLVIQVDNFNVMRENVGLAIAGNLTALGLLPDWLMLLVSQRYELLTAAKAAIAALTQNATLPADITATVKWLTEAVNYAEPLELDDNE